tara:strand:+ start:38952 stop:39602 length:651 start_codon:yes stop_codon:yes gene_type:complete
LKSLVLFDLDHTLISGDSEEAWVRYLNSIGWLDEDFFSQKLKFDEDYRNGKLNISSYSNFLLKPLKGKSVKEVQDLVKFFANDLIEKYKDSLTNKLLEEHKKDKCLIVSGSLTLLVKEISKLLDIENFFGTEAEIKKDLYTGRVKGVPNFSEEKVRRVKEWLIIKDLKFRDIYAYSDSIYDLPLLKYSNRARAVNPDNQLREISAKKGWEVIERAT